MMKRITLCFAAIALLGLGLQAQVCDQTVQPDSLRATYTPGTGVLLQWNPVPGSEGVGIKALPPGGAPALSKILIGPELSQFLVPDAVLTSGVYRWRVWSACSSTPPFRPSPISDVAEFEIPSEGCPAMVMDIDGNEYSTVEIGSQCWMVENLKVERYRDGSNIPTGLSDDAWDATTSGAFAVYGNLASNKATYGLLYNWFAVADARGLCPAGWHVATDGEWTELTDHLGGTSFAGGAMKTTGTICTGTGLWLAPNTAATNSSGFSALPGGSRISPSGFLFQWGRGNWWSSSLLNARFAWNRTLDYESGGVSRDVGVLEAGLSVRCIRD